jgi:hypothetical protein
VGNVNQYWNEGGKGPAPFSFDAGGPTRGSQNPSAAPAGDLYQPSLMSRAAPGAAVAGGGAAELGGS